MIIQYCIITLLCPRFCYICTKQRVLLYLTFVFNCLKGEESDASDLQCKCSAKRKSVMRSSSSEEQIGFSTSEEDDEIDKKYTEGQLTERGTGTLHYMDLKNANIFYNEKPDSIEEFMQDIKVDILKNFPEIPDFEESVKKLSSLTRDNLLFSFDLDNILKHLDDGYAHKNYVEVEWMKQIRSDFVRAEQVDKTLDLTDMQVVKCNLVSQTKCLNLKIK